MIPHRNKKFTLLELLIAVIIFLLVSVTVTAVYRTALKSYKRGIIYSDISQSISGTILAVDNDLSSIVRINDKESVFFEDDKFSFISVKKDKQGFSYLQQIKYSISDDKLIRNSVKYPDDVINIDLEPVLFLDDIDGLSFQYDYPKKDDATDENGDSDDKIDKNKNQDKDVASDKSKVDSDDDSDTIADIKVPCSIKISGTMKESGVERSFDTTLTVPLFVIQEMPKSDDKDKDKDKDKRNNSSSKDNNDDD